MADKPNGFQRFVGRVGDRFLAGSNNYDPATGRWSNVGPGLVGTAARLVGTFLGGPLVGAAVGRIANVAVDKYGNRTAQAPAQSAFVAPPPSATPNLGFPAQSPGGTWAGYLQGQGAVNNFGNSQFGNGMSSMPGSWSPASTWGQGIQEGQGSNLNFGNYSPGASGGGTGRGGSTGANRGMQVGSFSPSSGMGPGGARGSFLEKINRRGLNIN